MKIIFIEIAESWLKEHYPKDSEEIDPRWSAVFNFALFLDKQNENTKTKSN